MKYFKTIIVVAILLTTVGLVGTFSHSEKIKPNKDFSSFPMQIGDWKGTPASLNNEVYNVLGVEDYILANYRSDSGQFVNLYVGFYQSQKEGDIIHSPKNCMPGAGWGITESSLQDITIEKGRQVKIAKLLLAKGSQKQIVYYWFQSRGRIISSEYAQKIWLVYDSIVKNRTDGSFVRLISPVITSETDTMILLEKFAINTFPHLKEYIPL